MVVAGLLMILMLAMSAGCAKEASAPTSSAGKVETVELKLAHFWPAAHPAETDLVQPWAKEIEQATNGQVKIISYPGETLLKAADVYGGVKDGIADIGISCFHIHGAIPGNEVLSRRVLLNNSKVASKVWEGIN